MLLAKLRQPGIIAAALVVLSGVGFLLLQSHRSEPATPAAAEQPAPAVAAPAASSPVAETPSQAAQAPSAKGATAKGEVAQRVVPDVPQKASATIHGKVDVSVRVTVDAGGAVSDAALDSPGASKYFANLALDAARRWKFKPARADGQAVSSAWVLRFDFGPTGTEVAAAETAS